MMKPTGTLLAALAALLLAGCMATAPKVQVREPTTVRPVAAAQGAAPFGYGAMPGTPAVAPVAQLAVAPAHAAGPTAGAIFQVASYRGLFEDRRARFIGDVLTINIQEKHSAKRSSGSSIDRNGKVEAKVGLIPFLAASSTKRLAASGSSENTFEGKGETGTDNEFTGSITVTVIEVLPNGNMAVAGEKQVGINQNVETLRFSGTVNPSTVLPGNFVSSTQVADARLEVRGTGDIDRAQTTGWLSRFFLSFLPI